MFSKQKFLYASFKNKQISDENYQPMHPKKKHSDCFYCSPLNFPALKSYPFESSVHQVWVFRWKTAKKRQLTQKWRNENELKERRGEKTASKGSICEIFCRWILSIRLLPGLALFLWRSTIASRVQFKPIKTGANLVVNSSPSLLRSSTFPGHTAQKLYHEDFCCWAIVAW